MLQNNRAKLNKNSPCGLVFFSTSRKYVIIRGRKTEGKQNKLINFNSAQIYYIKRSYKLLETPGPPTILDKIPVMRLFP